MQLSSRPASVELKLEATNRIHYDVTVQTGDTHEVVYDKQRKSWTCTCDARTYGKECYHIRAAVGFRIAMRNAG